MIGEIKEITSKEAKEFLLPRHYSGRTPAISKAFGWFVDNELKAVCTYGKPATPAICNAVCGKKYYKSVFELNRLCREEDFHEYLSQFVAYTLRQLKKENWIIVSYSDTAMHHNGYIYQACSFLYTGQTKSRLDPYIGEGRHPRHQTKEDLENPIKVVRSAKNRYVYFCTSDKKLKREWLNALRFPVLPYPKAENQNYVLGEYMKPELVDTSKTKWKGAKT